MVFWHRVAKERNAAAQGRFKLKLSLPSSYYLQLFIVKTNKMFWTGNQALKTI